MPPQLRGLYYIYYISQSKYYSAGKENKICFYISFSSNRKTNLPPFFFYFFVSILDRSILRRETREEGEVPPSSVQLWSLFSSSSSSSLAAVISSPIISSLVFFFSLRSQRETTHKQKYTQKRSFCFRKDTKIKRGLSVSRFARAQGREPGTPRSASEEEEEENSLSLSFQNIIRIEYILLKSRLFFLNFLLSRIS